jgi:DNA primase catalytic core
VVGISPSLAEAWSARRGAIEGRRAQLSVAFQAEHRRPPTKVEEIALAQQATLETRPGKHPPRSLAEQRAQWRTSAEQLLGAAGVQQMLADTLPCTRPSHPPLTDEAVDRVVGDLARTVVATVETERATWQVTHVRAEAERQARAADLPPAQTDQVVDTVVAAVLADAVPLGCPDPVAAAPEVLRRRDGQSVYEVSGAQLYTTGRILAAERRILAAAARTDGRTCHARSVELALLEATANGTDLNPGQIDLIRQLATTPARVQLALAPAGTGKTTAMRALAQAWREDGGTVLGLAPSAAAAAVLRAEISTTTAVHCDTLAKLLDSLTRRRLPAWAATVDQRTLVIIDEAGMAATTDLACAIDWIIRRGGTVRLIGDDQQLASIASGGILRDLTDSCGAVTLPQVIRFRDPAEGAASLALRAGDPAALGYYLDHHRIHVGDPTTTVEHLFTAWAVDRAADRDTVMLAPTRDLVTQLNLRARQHRLASSRGCGRELRLADGSACSRGDPVITRHNDRRLPISRTDWVKNGDRWTVTAVCRDGSLTVRHQVTGRRITLPAGYARRHVGLGYATTIHGAQGITADTCHLLVTGTETRQLLYVGLSRGRDANHAYVTVAGDGDPHTMITRDALLPPTAVDLLTRIIGRDGAQRSAATAARAAADPATRLTHAAAGYHDALATAAVTILGPQRIVELDQAADRILPDLSRLPAYPTLQAHLALLAAAGRNPVTALRAALQERPLTDAHDPAAILDWRLTPASHDNAGPLPWLPAIPTPLATHPTWGPYLTSRATLVRDLTIEVRVATERWTPAMTPPWAMPLLDRDPALVGDLAIWRSATGVDPTDPTPAGAIPSYSAEQHHHALLTRRVHAVLGDRGRAQRHWTALADTLDPRLTRDPYWPQVTDRLTVADRAGLDIAELTTAVAATAPLPDEHPAAALWWRLARHLTRAALPATGMRTATPRPAWTPLLTGLLGQPTADRVIADPAWPALVAAVTDAGGQHWPPIQILTIARDLLHPGPGDAPLRPDEIATALVWRITALTDPSTAHPDADEQIPDDPANPPPPPNEPNPISAVDLAALPDALPVLDDDWLNSLQPPDDPDLPASTYEPSAVTVDPASSPHAPTRTSAWVGDDPAHDALSANPATQSGVPAGRLLELNHAALAYYRAHCPTSWAANYLKERLHTDLVGSPFQAGYAPSGWTHLTDHLRHHADATDTELLAAGLGTRTRAGRLIDRYRDRLMLPIHTPNGDLVGFIGRRHPRHDTDNDANSGGPKYLNTPETSLFTKRHLLYGLHETSPLLAAGAAPVLVEGPFDAIAVTLAGRGHYAGVASLGTAFTDQQADLLRPYLRDDTPVVVGTDSDPAGSAAAERAYWQLTARGDNPHQLRLPEGTDPAQLLTTHGTSALHEALTTATPLAHALTDARIAAHADRLHYPEGRVLAARACATVITALPPQAWHHHATRLTIAICPDNPLLLLDEVLAAAQASHPHHDPTGPPPAQPTHHPARQPHRPSLDHARQRTRHPAHP